MKHWHIKELSEQTKISVRMLRHYDKIGLLEPSYREPNGYRCYTAPDLAKLEQIIALKYFGFNLGTIKTMLEKHTDVYAHLQTQQLILKKEAEHFKQVYDCLTQVIDGLASSKSPDSQHLIKLIEEFTMTEGIREKLKASWAGKHLTSEQFEAYLHLYEQFPKEFAEKDKLIADINENRLGDPEGAEAERAIEKMHAIGKKMREHYVENMKLGVSMMESIRSGQLTSLELTTEGMHWLAKAGLAYWLKRWNGLYDKIVAHKQEKPEGKAGKTLAHAWRVLMTEYCSAGSKDFAMGILLWQELARQDDEIKKLKTLPTAQEMIQRCHIKILFDPDASAWIIQALDYHA